MPVQMVVTCGVLCTGCTRAKYFGSSPSRLMEKKMRGWPIWNTSSTAVVATTAPRDTRPTSHWAAWLYCSPATSGSAILSFISVKGIMPVSATVTST